MKFYDCKTAPSPRRVRIFLAEKGVELETAQVDLGSGEQFGEAFRKINPDCVVPVLELDNGHSEQFAHQIMVADLAFIDGLTVRHDSETLAGIVMAAIEPRPWTI